MPGDALSMILNGRVAGELHRRAGNRLYLRYDNAYCADSTVAPLSVSMPLLREEHGDQQITPWLYRWFEPLAQRFDVGDDLGGVLGQILAFEVVGLRHRAVRRDQVADPAGKAVLEVGLALGPLGVIGPPDGPVRVGDQLEREALAIHKALLIFNRVERRPHDNSA